MSDPGSVTIHYRRPPDRIDLFEQRVVLERADVVVTLAERVELDRPIEIDGRVALEPASAVVWFTFPGRWHDVGRFHTADGTFTGLYANVLTPPEMEGRVWRTTDLYLDVWVAPGRPPRILDEEELEGAVARGLVDGATAERARVEAADLVARAREGAWPPPVVEAWTLERARRAFGAEPRPHPTR